MSIEAGSRIGDLLSFDLVLLGKFLKGLFIDRVGVGIAVFSSWLIFSMKVYIWADDLLLIAARSLRVDDAPEALVASFLSSSSEAFISFIKLSQSPGSSWISQSVHIISLERFLVGLFENLLLFFLYFGGVKCYYIGVDFYYFPLFFIDTLLTSVTPCFFLSIF